MIDRPGWKRGTRMADTVEPPAITEPIADTPNFGVPDFEKFPTTTSEGAFEDLNALIGDFAQKIGEEYEVGVCLGVGQAPFQLEEVTLRRELFIFKGFDPLGNATVAVQHYSSLSLQLVQVKKSLA